MLFKHIRDPDIVKKLPGILHFAWKVVNTLFVVPPLGGKKHDCSQTA